MFKSLISFNLTLGKMSKALKKVCLCNLINVILIVFIFVVSFYLIRRLNKVDIETFVIKSRAFGPETTKTPMEFVRFSN